MSPSVTAGQRYVLVVEDDSSVRELYRLTLQKAGFVVVAVEDGLSALHRINAAKPQVVVLDLGLPRLSGRDVQQELKAHPDTEHIPVVVVSGADTSDLNLADFACVLQKPVSVELLIEAVEQCLRSRAVSR